MTEPSGGDAIDPIVQSAHAETTMATDAISAVRARHTLIVILVMLGYQGFTMAINGIGAPWIAKSFGLDHSGIAALFARISVASIGALTLSRFADRVGRRRVLLWCIAATPVCALGAALSFSLTLFTLFEILLYAFIGATVSGSVVMLAEELPIDQRARGQSFGGLALGLGSGLCVFLMPLLEYGGYSWRWLLAIAAAGLLGVPSIARVIPESERWARAAASGATGRSSFYDVFGHRYRRRAAAMLCCSLLGTVAGTAAFSWTFFHVVSVVGLSAATASTIVIIGGGVGMLGFPLGAWGCERAGRVPTVAGAGLLIAVGGLGFYWGPPTQFAYPALWLAVGYAWFSLAANVTVVGGNAAATELFPTALRGTMIGWFSLTTAIGSVTAQGTLALLAAGFGGLSNVIGYLTLLTIPSAIIFGLFVEETRGLSLEVAAREPE